MNMITPGVTGQSEPTSQEQMEAQARVFIARQIRNIQCTGCECSHEPSISEAKREITIQIRRARKLAQDEAARYIALCLDYGAPPLPDTISRDLLQALRRVNTLAKMLRGPNSESD